MSQKLQRWRAKIGTIPSPGIVIRTKPVVGKYIMFRDYKSKIWERGIVDKIDTETGYLFISRF